MISPISKVPMYYLTDKSSPCYYCKFRVDNKKHNGEICALSSLFQETPIDAVKDYMCDEMEFSEEWQELIDRFEYFEAFNTSGSQWALINAIERD